MSIVIPETELPSDLDLPQAVESAYAAELAGAADRLQRGLPTLIECDKELVPFLFANIRDRLKSTGMKFAYLDGRKADAAPAPGTLPIGMMGAGAASALRPSR